MNVIVEDVTSNFLTSTKIYEIFVISDVSNHLLNILHTFSSSFHASHINNDIKTDSLNAAVFKIFINTVNAMSDKV